MTFVLVTQTTGEPVFLNMRMVGSLYRSPDSDCTFIAFLLSEKGNGSDRYRVRETPEQILKAGLAAGRAGANVPFAVASEHTRGE